MYFEIYQMLSSEYWDGHIVFFISFIYFAIRKYTDNFLLLNQPWITCHTWSWCIIFLHNVGSNLLKFWLELFNLSSWGILVGSILFYNMFICFLYQTTSGFVECVFNDQKCLHRSNITSSLNLWKNYPMKPSGLGVSLWKVFKPEVKFL